MSELKQDTELSKTEQGQDDARQVDVAAAYLNGTESYEPLSPAEEKKMIRKIDWILLPMVRRSANVLGSCDGR